MMRTFCLLLGLLLPVSLWAEAVGTVIKREAGRCALAWQKNDYEGIVNYLPPRVIEKTGGRAAVLREIKEQFAQARSLGASRLEAFPGLASKPKQFGKWLTTLVPLTAILHGPHLDLTQETQVLGVSLDGGKHWSFVVLYQTAQAELNAWFPEFAGQVIVSTPPPPRVEFVY